MAVAALATGFVAAKSVSTPQTIGMLNGPIKGIDPEFPIEPAYELKHTSYAEISGDYKNLGLVAEDIGHAHGHWKTKMLQYEI